MSKPGAPLAELRDIVSDETLRGACGSSQRRRGRAPGTYADLVQTKRRFCASHDSIRARCGAGYFQVDPGTTCTLVFAEGAPTLRVTGVAVSYGVGHGVTGRTYREPTIFSSK